MGILDHETPWKDTTRSPGSIQKPNERRSWFPNVAWLSINSLAISSHPTDRNDGKPYNGALYKNSKVDEWKSHRKFLWELRCTYPDHSSLVNCLGTKSSWSLWQRKLSWISWLNDKSVIPIAGDPMTHTSCRESILMFILRVVPKKSLNAPVGMLFFILTAHFGPRNLTCLVTCALVSQQGQACLAAKNDAGTLRMASTLAV